MSRPFQFNSKKIFLTYPQCNLEKQTVLSHFQNEQSFPKLSYAIVAQERHQSGEPHIHVFIEFERPFRTRDPRGFDINSFHPNVQSARNRLHVIQYVRKHGDVLEHGNINIRSNWGNILESSHNKRDFFTLVQQEYPRDYILNHERLEYFANKHFQHEIEMYTPQRMDFKPNAELIDWYVQNFYGPRQERPKSLILIGPSRIGKTSWARSLGNHIYWNQMMNLEDWNYDATYMVLDDFEWDRVPSKKGLLGAQQTIILSDKYKKKQTLNWGNPCILLMNEDDAQKIVYTDWLYCNSVIIRINNKIF